MSNAISNSEDFIDSRDIIARLEYLADSLDDEELDPSERDDLLAELGSLKSFASEAEDYAPDWKYGATLLRDSYFKEYAMELAEDIGAIKADATWPNNHIDWDAAADELKIDYTAIDFDGVTYWVR